MSVLSNNVIAGASIADDAAGGAYQIEKSLRFNSADSAYLGKVGFDRGNNRTWTWSGWVKRGKLTANQTLFNGYHDGNDKMYVKFTSTDELYYASQDGGTWAEGTTVAKYRDPSAWMHVVIAVNTTDGTAADRFKIYVNGELQNLTSVTSPSQHANTWVHGETLSTVGALRDTSYGQGCDLFLSDVQFIDGLQLAPAAFGSFDDSNCWNPKAFALPTPNDGTTWSSNCTFTNTDRPAANLFDGLTANSAAGVIQDNSSNTAKVAFNTEVKGSIIEVWSDSGTNVIGFNTDTPNQSVSGAAWHTIYSGPETTLEKITWKHGSSQGRLDAIRVDGVILRDGLTDPTTRVNPNNGRVWSSDLTKSTSSNWNNEPSYSFDGGSGSASIYDPTDGSTYTEWAPSPGVAYSSKVELFIAGYPNGDYSLNGGSWTAIGDSESLGFQTIATGSGTITNLKFRRVARDGYDAGSTTFPSIVKVDGHALLDSAVDNSYHLKFNDTTKNRYLGKDTLNGKIAGSTGGLPIYNTTDDYGDVKGSGYRADSSAGTTDGTGLVFAWPGDTTTGEVHASINTGSSAKTVTANGDPSVDTTQSRLYGSSVAFDRTGDYLSVDGGSDFNFGTGDYTIECWFMTTDNSVNEGIFVLSDTSGGLATDESSHITAMVDSNGMNIRPGDGTTSTLFGTTKPANDTWHHLALTRDSGTFRAFYDGALLYTKTNVTTSHADQYLAIGGYYSTSYLWKGNIQDFRIYKGTAKYTASFTSPARNDFTVNNLTEATPSYNYPIVTKAKVRAVFNGSRGAYYTVDYSDDNSNWTNAFGGDMAATGCDWFDGTVTSGTNDGSYGGHQYWRYVVGANSNQHHPNVNKIALVDIDGTETIIANSGNADNCSDSGFGASGNVQGTVRKHTYSSGTFAIPGPYLDSFTDTPTNYGTESDPAVGGEVRGNYCTLNPLDKHSDITLSQGNLNALWGSASNRAGASTFGLTSGKWYFEWTPLEVGSASKSLQVGVCDSGGLDTDNLLEYATGAVWCLQTNGYAYGDTGNGQNVFQDNAHESISTSHTVGVAIDIDAQKIWYSRNNVWNNIGGSAQGNPATGANPVATSVVASAGRVLLPSYSLYNDSVNLNFGQRAFKYTAPSGFKTLCTQNLDDTFSGDELNNPSKYFDIQTWNGTSTERDIKDFNFNPDLVWVKSRSDADNHVVADVIRGSGAVLASDTNNSQGDFGVPAAWGSVKTFNSDGFTVQTGSSGYHRVNLSGRTYVGWAWDAGTAASGANNDGSINISAGNQWKNATAGFSITKYTGTGSAATIGHGLGAKPDFIITKRTDGSSDWAVYHSALGAEKHLRLNEDNAVEDSNYAWNDTEPTNSVFSVANASFSGDPHDYIAYCWTSIPGYSKFGTYTGNGSTDGVFIPLDFRPLYFMVKRTDSSGLWCIYDAKRSPNNQNEVLLRAHLNGAELTLSGDPNIKHDMLSNGFKYRNSSSSQNGSGNSYVYFAFAEHPLKTARAR